MQREPFILTKVLGRVSFIPKDHLVCNCSPPRRPKWSKPHMSVKKIHYNLKISLFKSFGCGLTSYSLYLSPARLRDNLNLIEIHHTWNLNLFSLVTAVGNGMVLHAIRTERRLQTVNLSYPHQIRHHHRRHHHHRHHHHHHHQHHV